MEDDHRRQLSAEAEMGVTAENTGHQAFKKKKFAWNQCLKIRILVPDSELHAEGFCLLPKIKCIRKLSIC
jgi:hypothetical protein